MYWCYWQVLLKWACLLNFRFGWKFWLKFVTTVGKYLYELFCFCGPALWLILKILKNLGFRNAILLLCAIQWKNIQWVGIWVVFKLSWLPPIPPPSTWACCLMGLNSLKFNPCLKGKKRTILSLQLGIGIRMIMFLSHYILLYNFLIKWRHSCRGKEFFVYYLLLQ